jgi:hypothetical protein
MPMAVMIEDKAVLEQVERILHSQELRSSDVLRRLFRFLAEKSASGEADELKEYVVAIEGMGKPTSYDPRHDSAVRIQVGRLRQKLADFYRLEGREDTVVISIPKGHFKLDFEHRESPSSPDLTVPLNPELYESQMHRRSVSDEASTHSAINWQKVSWLLVGIFAAIAIAEPILSRRVSEASALQPALKELWEPFLISKRPILVAIEDPLFVEFPTGAGIYVRDKSINDWHDIGGSAAVSGVRESLKGVDPQPSHYYTAFGEVHSAFLFGKFLGPRVENFTVVKTSDLSYQQLADNDVVFVGVQNLFFESQLKLMPIELQFIPNAEGIRNVHPQASEQALYADKYSTAPQEEGVTYALVTHLPGPLGNNDIESFASNRSAGYIGAVKAFTDPAISKTIVDQLKQQSGGHMPRYFQALLRVKFKAEIPIETVCLITRELR